MDDKQIALGKYAWLIWAAGVFLLTSSYSMQWKYIFAALTVCFYVVVVGKEPPLY